LHSEVATLEFATQLTAQENGELPLLSGSSVCGLSFSLLFCMILMLLPQQYQPKSAQTIFLIIFFVYQVRSILKIDGSLSDIRSIMKARLLQLKSMENLNTLRNENGNSNNNNDDDHDNDDNNDNTVQV
jgi:hypothetical protein